MLGKCRTRLKAENYLNDTHWEGISSCETVELSMLSEEKAEKSNKNLIFFDSKELIRDFHIANLRELRDKENDPAFQAELRRKAEEKQLKAEG